jgi:hypothetical protein
MYDYSRKLISINSGRRLIPDRVLRRSSRMDVKTAVEFGDLSEKLASIKPPKTKKKTERQPHKISGTDDTHGKNHLPSRRAKRTAFLTTGDLHGRRG